LKMVQKVAKDVEDNSDVVLAVAEAIVVEMVVESDAVLFAYRRLCMRGTVLEELDPLDSAVEVLYVLNAAVALIETSVFLERLPVHSIHSFHDHDR
jgi:hypothetical protein